MKGIRLSEKHGLNPTVCICFWCGKNSGEVALLGRLPGDREAARRSIVTYEPCEQCKAVFDLGFAIIEVDDQPIREGQPPISPGAYPTGGWAIVKMEAAEKKFSAEILKHKKVLFHKDVFRESIPYDPES